VARVIALLRGVNLAGRNRVAMPQLRTALEDAGFEGVGTYLQSGNIVLSTNRPARQVAKRIAAVVGEQFGLDIAVVVRKRDEIADVIERDPLGSIATDPKRYQVTFLDNPPDRAAIEKLRAAVTAGEEVVHDGLEVYTWHPAGIGRSKLARLLSGKELGATATARNWSTVTALLALADET
jgi:uncharacterized protein (DUF1697 family)